MSNFTSIANSHEIVFKDRGSKFIAQAHRIDTKEDVDEIVADLRKAHPKSRHVCYAYIINEQEGLFRANDDGEPSNSAGMPILNQIRSANLRYVLITVVRYFGGTLLGVPGLINAYKSSATSAIESAELVEDFEKTIISLHFGYEMMENVMSYIKRENIEISKSKFEESCKLNCIIPNDLVTVCVDYFKNLGVKTTI